MAAVSGLVVCLETGSIRIDKVSNLAAELNWSTGFHLGLNFGETTATSRGQKANSTLTSPQARSNKALTRRPHMSIQDLQWPWEERAPWWRFPSFHKLEAVFTSPAQFNSCSAQFDWHSRECLSGQFAAGCGSSKFYIVTQRS